MWENIIFWRIATISAGALLVFLVVLFYFVYVKAKKNEQEYNDSIDRAEKDVLKLKAKEEQLNKELGMSITTLVDLLSIYERWVETKEPSAKLEFQTTFKELPVEVRNLIKMKL
jgi:hypothetical protein